MTNRRPPDAPAPSQREGPPKPRSGNAGATGTAEARAHEPPPEVDHDPVDEPSWESFPASDPPAGRHIT